MNKIISICLLIVLFGVYISVALSAPWVLSDCNGFLKIFVGYPLLNLLGIIVAITSASSVNLHFELNKIENELKSEFLTPTRLAVKRSVISLILLFSFGFLLVITKPSVPINEISYALINGLAVLIVIFNILVLIDLTQLVFKIVPVFKMIPPNEHEKNMEKLHTKTKNESATNE